MKCHCSHADWMEADPYEPPTYECDWCGLFYETDYLREYLKDVDGSLGDICIKCIHRGVLERHIPKGS